MRNVFLRGALAGAGAGLVTSLASYVWLEPLLTRRSRWKGTATVTVRSAARPRSCSGCHRGSCWSGSRSGCCSPAPTGTTYHLATVAAQHRAGRSRVRCSGTRAATAVSGRRPGHHRRPHRGVRRRRPSGSRLRLPDPLTRAACPPVRAARRRLRCPERACARRVERRGHDRSTGLRPLRVLLVRHPGTPATRAPVVPADEPPAGPVPDLTRWVGRGGHIATSPARRCTVPGALIEPRLGPWDLGTWTGRPWHELDLKSWRVDPSYNAHGGRVTDRATRPRRRRTRRVAHRTRARRSGDAAAVIKARRTRPTSTHRSDVEPRRRTSLTN